MGQNLLKNGLKMVCSQVSKLVEWLKNGKNCFIVGQKWRKKMYSKRCKVGPKNGSKKGSGHGLTMVLNWVKMCFSKIVQKNLEKYFAKLGKC